MAERRWEIYTLSDPRDGVVWYVGKTHDRQTRIRAHVAQARRGVGSRKCNWLRSLSEAGLAPAITAIESGVGLSWKRAERRWIAFYRKQNRFLTNTSDGGDGPPVGVKMPPRTPESRARMAAVWTGRKHKDESKAKMAAAKVGKKLGPRDQEIVEKIRAAQIGKPKGAPSPETRAKRSAALKGKSWTAARRAAAAARKGTGHSEETKAKIRSAYVARGTERNSEIRAKQLETARRNGSFARSPDTRAKISAALKGRKRTPLSPEHRARLSASKKGRKLTPEQRQQISERQKGKKRGPRPTRSAEWCAKLSEAAKRRSPEWKARFAAGAGAASEARWAKQRANDSRVSGEAAVSV